MLDVRRAHLVVGALIVAADQLSKAWALDALADGRTIEILGSLQLRLARNTGASFSVGSGSGALIGVVAACIAVAMVVLGPRVHGVLAQVAVGMVLGGAVGNLLDRLARSGSGPFGGAVVDFIDLQWWPVFNVADVGVVCGGILLVWATRERADGAGAPASVDHGG